MEDEDLRRFLAGVLLDDPDPDSEEMAIVGKLIRLTLEYRDNLKSQKNEKLTVEDTRRALDIYEQVIKTGKMPSETDDKITGLVKLWLQKINKHRF